MLQLVWKSTKQLVRYSSRGKWVIKILKPVVKITTGFLLLTKNFIICLIATILHVWYNIFVFIIWRRECQIALNVGVW